MEQQDWMMDELDRYLMDLARQMGDMSTCNRGKPGAVISDKNGVLLSGGFASAPKGADICDDVGHMMAHVVHPDENGRDHCVRTVHAEQMAICKAAESGTAIKDGSIHVTMTPCYVCSMLIVASGLKRVVAGNRYHADSASLELLMQCGIAVRILNPDREIY